jgi:VWFA-related protein
MKRAATICLLCSPLLAQDVQKPQDATVFRDDVRFITVDVQVVVHDRPVVGLTKQDFQVFDNGEPQTITNLAFDEAPLDIMLSLDISGCTDNVAFEMQNQIAGAMPHLRIKDRIGLAVFAELAYLAVPITANRDELKAGIYNRSWRRSVSRATPTELNRSTLNTSQYLRETARPGARRAIIALTDNQGMAAVSQAKVRDGLWETDVLLNAIFFRGDADDYDFPADLRVFVDSTGGEELYAVGAYLRLGEMFDRLRKRYVLLYRAPQSAPGRVHSIRVDLNPQMKAGTKGLVIRARSGYRADQPGSDNRLNPKGKN